MPALPGATVWQCVAFEGVRLVWVVDSRSRTVTAYHPSGDAHPYSDSDQVPGEDVLPGFSFRPTELFG